MWIRNSYLVFPLQWQKMLKLGLVGSIPSHNWISLEVSHTVRQWMRSRHSIGPLMNLKYSHGQHIVPRRCILSRDNRMYICVTHTYISVFSQGNGPKVRNIILSLSVPLGCQWGIFQSSPSSYFEKKMTLQSQELFLIWLHWQSIRFAKAVTVNQMSSL